jgi:hypothetical protein
MCEINTKRENIFVLPLNNTLFEILIKYNMLPKQLTHSLSSS